jgi:hypothetical protein
MGGYDAVYDQADQFARQFEIEKIMRRRGRRDLQKVIESAGREDRWRSGRKPHGRNIPKPWPGSPCQYDAA